ncbi:MAG: carbohydrate ABC transporter permease, partial [Clostridiales bacterium]|nr:carbohydrate ABC transporter permease [Clostridiales bacterium]
VSNWELLFLPTVINMKAYKELLGYAKLWIGYRNTILYAVLGTAIVLVVNIPASYALSRKKLYGKKLFTFFYLIPMFFSGGLIPTYLAVKNFNLLDTIWVMELWEAAQLDCCGYIGFFFRVVLPLSKAVLAVIALWAAVGQWNSYFNALIYLRSEELQPLQIVLRNILISNQTISSMTTGAAAVEAKQMADLIKYAVIVVSSAPIMCLYPFVQKYFNQGVMLGSLKG